LVCRSDGCTPHAAAAVSAASDDKAKPSRRGRNDCRARNTRTYDHTHRARAAWKIADGAGKNRPTRTARRRPIFQPTRATSFAFSSALTSFATLLYRGTL